PMRGRWRKATPGRATMERSASADSSCAWTDQPSRNGYNRRFFARKKPTMHRYLAIAAALVLGACASTGDPTSTAKKPMEEKEYRVGSRIPVKEPVGAAPTTTADPSD